MWVKSSKEVGAKKQLDLLSADPGTIKIDCSGAYIANDHLFSLKEEDSSSSPHVTDSSSDSDEDKLNEKRGEQNALANIEESQKSSKDSQLSTSEFDITKNITLPKHNSEVIHISVDIGGTLTKLVYFTRSHKGDQADGGRLHFKDFQTDSFENEVLDFVINLISRSIHKVQNPPITYIMATGGGAQKFYSLMEATFRKHRFPMRIVAKDEMECLIKGLDWLITKIPNEIFTYDLQEDKSKFIPGPQEESEIYPYLLVNIGSGVSMVKVTGYGPRDFERIGGSSLGGGTLWGLLSLLTDAKDYNEMLEMAQRGNNENIDLLVGDIYGANYNKIGLKSSHIASSFAKVFKKLRFENGNSKSNDNRVLSPAEKLSQFRPEDISRSLLYSVSNNIGQIACLQALRFNLKRIYFGGSYISGHMQTIHTLSFAVNFWSKGDMKPYFLRHEGYLGSVGAFIMGPSSEKAFPTTPS